ncbi:MAG: hypothetical protein NDF57_01455 [archaeon GBS-70-058]|nr:hypothetical protein [Candidatus Culexarchaeum nevadense]
MSEWDPILFQLGVGAITGFIVGYALKKIMKVLIIIMGIFLLALAYLQWNGIIKVDYATLIGKIENATKSLLGESTPLISQITANIPFAGSFLAGFYIGYKKG